MLCISFVFCIANCHKLSSLKQCPFITHSSLGQKADTRGCVLYLGYPMAKIKVLARLSSWLETKGKS